MVDDFNYCHWRMLGKIGLAWEGDRFRLGAAVTTPSAGLFGSGNVGFTRSATGVDLNGDGRPDSLLANGLDEDLDASYQSAWALAGGGAWRKGSLQLHVTAEYFAAVDAFTVLQGQSPTPSGPPVALTQSLDSVLNAGSAPSTGSAGWARIGLAVRRDRDLRRVRHRPLGLPRGRGRRSLDLEPEPLPPHGGTSFSVGSSRFSVGVSYAFGSKRRNIGFGGLPPSVPIIGAAREVDSSFSRLVFVLGYLFGR